MVRGESASKLVPLTARGLSPFSSLLLLMLSPVARAKRDSFGMPWRKGGGEYEGVHEPGVKRGGGNTLVRVG